VRDQFRASRRALVLVGAIAEAQLVHFRNHVEDADVALGLALGKQRKLRNFGRHEEHGRCVFAGCHASPAADASGGVHRQIGILFGNRKRVGVLRRTGADADEATRLLDFIERGAVGDEVFDDRKGPCAVGLYGDDRAVLEAAHVGLARGNALVRPMRLAVDDERAGATNAFAAIVRKSDRILAALFEVVVYDVEHFEEGHVRVTVRRFVFDEFPRLVARRLPPDLQRNRNVFARRSGGVSVRSHCVGGFFLKFSDSAKRVRNKEKVESA